MLNFLYINKKNEIIYAFDKQQPIEDKLKNLTDKKIIGDYTKGSIKIYSYKSDVPGGEIYHFSIPFSSMVDQNKNAGVAVIGINSKMVQDNMINSIIEIFLSFIIWY
jgi:hypothetical protein